MWPCVVALCLYCQSLNVHLFVIVVVLFAASHAETVLGLFASVCSQLCLSSVVWSHFMLFVYSLCILHLFQELSASLCGLLCVSLWSFTDSPCSQSLQTEALAQQLPDPSGP